jgi:hypothetical protein|nr:MAG TPA: tail collar fiber protein [Caudoviricetes sp.]
MANFRQVVITNKGLNILNNALAQKQAVVLKTIKTGNGTYDGNEVLENYTDLKSYKNSFAISRISVIDNNTIKIQTAITNDNIAVGYNITEYGVYAEVNKTEVLVAITTAINSDFIPDKQTSPATILLEIYLKISRANQITFSYSIPDGVYARQDDLDRKADIDTVNRILTTKSFVLLASNWSNTAPFVQEVAVAGVKSSDSSVVGLDTSNHINNAQYIKAMKKAWSCVDRIESLEGKIRAYCANKKPAVDIYLTAKGV